MKQYSQAEQVLEEGKRYGATISTSQGDIKVELFVGESPVTANNFAFLAKEGFYDGTVIHRVVPGFVVQMGDPTGTGTGGPGYKFADELSSARNRGYDRGIMAMANAGPNTNGSQFFLISGPSGAGLPPQYSLFGQVTQGLEVIKAIEDVGIPGTQDGKPSEVVKINSVTIKET